MTDLHPPPVSVKARAKEINDRAAEEAAQHSGARRATSRIQCHHLSTSKDDRPCQGSDDKEYQGWKSSERPLKAEVQHPAPPTSPLHSCPATHPVVHGSACLQVRRSSEGDLLPKSPHRSSSSSTTAPCPRRRCSVEGFRVIRRPQQGQFAGASALGHHGSTSDVRGLEIRSLLGNVQEEGGGAVECQTVSKFAPFTARSSGIWRSDPPRGIPDAFSPAIFSSNPPSSVREKPSPLDDIISALEKICDEFSAKDDEPRFSEGESTSESSPLSSSLKSAHTGYLCEAGQGEIEQFPHEAVHERAAKSIHKSLDYLNFEHSAPRTNDGVNQPKYNGRISKAMNGRLEGERGDQELYCQSPSALFPSSSTGRRLSEPILHCVEGQNCHGSNVDPKVCHSSLLDSKNYPRQELNLPTYITLGRKEVGDKRKTRNSLCSEGSRSDGESDESHSEIEKVRNILAGLDFAKYKRGSNLLAVASAIGPSSGRSATLSMDKSPKPPRSPKIVNPRLKDLFDLLKPSSDTVASRPYLICRSSSFSHSDADAVVKGKDEVTKQDIGTCKTSTLPKRKKPQCFLSSVKESPPMPAVASCPSIVKLDQKEPTSESDHTNDEGLVSDSDSGPCYVSAYSCVTSSPLLQKGHVRSASDNVTLIPTPQLTEDSRKLKSSEKLSPAPDKRKRRKGIGGPATGFVPGAVVEHTKTGNGRSLTYPPQRKSSVSEEEQEFSSVDSNGLRSLKLNVGLTNHDSLRPLSDLSLADSHFCPSEGTVEETYQDVVESVTQASNDRQHLSVDEKSGGSNGKIPKKKHNSDPGGDMSSEGVAFPEIIGASRSEPDLGDSSTKGSSISQSSPEGTGGPNLRLIIDTHEGSETPNTSTIHHTRHLCVGTGTLTPSQISQSRFFCPDGERSGVDPHLSKSPQEQRRYSKRRLRGPYGEMLEEEMRKSGEKQKTSYNDLSFLHVLSDGTDVSNAPDSAPVTSASTPQSRPSVFCSSQSLDDTSIKCDSPDSVVAPKRKISANYPLVGESGVCQLATLESVSSSDEFNSNKVSQERESHEANGDSNSKPDFKNDNSAKDDDGLTEASKTPEDIAADTRTHVFGELFDTEKSYVESLQILTNKYMKPLKSPEYAGVVETSLVDEIFFQIPEILSHHVSFLDVLKQRLAAWDSKQKVGDVFVEAFTKQQVIDTYTAFINNWKAAKEAIKTASQAKPAFARFLEHMTREHKGKLTLDALLIMPVQRIPRYELLIKELLKHTHVDHPDHQPLILAQKEVHDLAVKINRVEREAFQQELNQKEVREVEQFIEGVIDLVQPDRAFIRYDVVTIPGGLGAKKDRCLFLFSDILLITSLKRKSGTMRKPSSTTSGTPNALSNLEMNKCKFLTRFSLDNLDVTKGTDSISKKLSKDIENLEEDITLITQINEMVSSISAQHQALEEALKELMGSVTKQLAEKQNADAQLVSLELSVTTQEGVDNLTILFSSADKRATWELAFNNAKQKLALSTDRRPPPEFMHPLPIRKTRAGLQFTCATATLGFNQQGLRDVWVCNSDGYVGQVCVLSLQPEPTVMSCNGVCNARIVTIASIPAAASVYPEKCRWRSTIPDNLTGVSIEVEEVDEEFEDERTNNGNIQLDSDSSDEDEDGGESPDDDKPKEESRKRGSSVPREECHDDMDHRQPTMWLGTEDGCIHVYNCNDNIRTKKNKIKIQHSAAIHCIIYLDNRVFVALANGELHIYKKDPEGDGWSSSEPQTVQVGNLVAPITKMLAVAGKLWCGCQNSVKVLNTSTLQIEHTFTVSNDTTRTVLCIVTSGLGVWIALQHSAVLRLFHATSYECLLDVNVAPAVTKMLAGCDDIIRQHKAACLRVTAMLACKDLLWVGTSAGVVLTLPLPHLTSTTTKLDSVPNVAGIPHGHTGHVRFLTCVEMMPGTTLDLAGFGKYGHRSLRNKEGTAGRRASTTATAGCKLLVISGGDGYEDFRSSGLSEAVGRDDSTNHLLLWQV